MTHILALESSVSGDGSTSNELARHLIQKLEKQGGKTVVTRRDLSTSDIPHMDGDFLGGIFAEAKDRSPEQEEVVALTETLLDEIAAADTLVIASPMYNFSIPSTLKAWIDHITLAGKTFRYTKDGPVGLLKGKKVYLVVSRGSDYSDPAIQVKDFQVPYLKTVLGFMGMTDISVIAAEGQAISPESAEAGKAAAYEQIDALFASSAVAAE